MQNFGAGHWDFEYPTLMEVKNYMYHEKCDR